jgi:hypothetical protein
MRELTAFKLTPLGLVHTLVSLVCVGLAIAAVLVERRVDPGAPLGFWYLVTLWVTTLTGFPIFRSGKLTPPHVLGWVTVAVLLLAALAGNTSVFGRASLAVETVCYSFSVLLILIPTFTETLTRVPPRAPWVKSPNAPVLLGIHSVLFVLFLIAVTLQLRGLPA